MLSFQQADLLDSGCPKSDDYASMTEIPLTRGKVAFVDDADVALVAGYRWSAWNYYGGRKHYAGVMIRRDGKRVTLLMHRLILGLTGSEHIDHWDGDGLNNARHNLRVCTRTQNQANSRTLRSHNTSGIKGVGFYRPTARWRAYIRVAGKDIHLGFFNSKADAALAYDAAARQYFGEFAATNAEAGRL